MRILFFGDGEWATRSLARLTAEHQIVGVVTRVAVTDPELAAAGAHLGIPVVAPANANSEDFLAWVASRAPDLLLSVSFDQIVRAPVLRAAPLGFINFHAGRLPRYRGRNVINWAIINGETEVGLTAHYIDEGIDTGDIVLQRRLPIAWEDTYAEVLGTVVRAFPDFVAEAVSQIASGTASRTSQSADVGTYFPLRRIGDEWIDWSDTSRNIYNKIRAISQPGPGARSAIEANEIALWKASYDPAWPAYIATPGQVVGRTDAGAYVKTGDSVVLVSEFSALGAQPCRPAWRIGTRLQSKTDVEIARLHARIVGLESAGDQ